MQTENQIEFIFQAQGFVPDAIEEQSFWKEWEDSKPQLYLYKMGFCERELYKTPSGNFLYQVADRFFKDLTNIPELELERENIVLTPSEHSISVLLDSVPFVPGAEYINEDWIQERFAELIEIFRQEIKLYQGSVSLYLTEKSQHLRVPERIFFHLVETKKEDYEFAFLATYATKDMAGTVRHMPLEYALTEFHNSREKLLELLSCLNKAAEISPLISGFMEKGELFHALRLSPAEAYEFLRDIPQIEEAGILCRIPDWWKKQSAMVSLDVSMGEEKPIFVGIDAVLSMRPKLVVDGIVLTEEEVRNLLAQTEGLAFLKGKWIEVNHKKLEALLEQMDDCQESITLREALHMGLEQTESIDLDGAFKVSNGKWLSELLANLRAPAKIVSCKAPKTFHAALRAYQEVGLTWLAYMNQLGFGACLADDMGLGKTVQVLAYLDMLRETKKAKRVLLVVPASLVGNWQKEAAKFSPKIGITVLHGKAVGELTEECQKSKSLLTITTYGMILRMDVLTKETWDCIILDEAQAIKNPKTKQTRAIKQLKGKMRIAMTGTPIENELSNLWSLFDFLNKGLLGTAQEFSDFSKNLSNNPGGYTKLRNMISPFLLRRLKTDKSIISDLPDKLETIDYVKLNKKQIVLYRKAVNNLAEKLEEAVGIERKGLILGALTKLKQICNHPDQYLGGEAYIPEESGKFEKLRELCETIYAKRERVLIFTQYKEITEQLKIFLETIFHAKGLVLHGSVPVKKRTELVEAFNGNNYIPFMVLSVKAGGTGLNLVAANHVIHFDRWWNPAVENQATDRAYRIGQDKKVLVHKMVCEGTIEEKINQMISSKKELAENVIGEGGENWITELSNDALISALQLSS